ncbi:MAG TPA: hypothetical protein VF765_26065 [Polyangiaceae bacterium]
MRRVVGAMGALFVGSACTACYAVPDLVPSRDGGSTASDAAIVAETSDGRSSGTDAGHEASTPGDAASCGTLSPCNNNLDCTVDCTTHVCAVDPIVAPDVLSAAGGAFCTRPCCTSADCPSGTVCFASGEGGQYCVNPSWIGRGQPGMSTGARGGTGCSKGSDCRSGLCTNGTCQDTCCSAISASAECASGTTCVFGTFPGASAADTHFASHCAPPQGSGGEDAPCQTNADCTSGMCFAGNTQQCMNPCRNSVDCGDPSDACGYNLQGNDLFAQCFPPPTGTLPIGSACNQNSMSIQCQSYYCGPSGCTGVCFTNSDCTYSNWTCAPVSAALGSTGQIYDALFCGPP